MTALRVKMLMSATSKQQNKKIFSPFIFKAILKLRCIWQFNFIISKRAWILHLEKVNFMTNHVKSRLIISLTPYATIICFKPSLIIKISIVYCICQFCFLAGYLKQLCFTKKEKEKKREREDICICR